MIPTAALLLLAAATMSAAATAAPADAGTQEMGILMPAVSPKQEDTYLCTAVRLDDNAYIRGFNPQHASGHAHHILLTACAEPGSMTEKVWNCGEMLNENENSHAGAQYKAAPQCAKNTRIIYAYAMEAPALKLPADVTFGVGPKFGLPWLVVQVHYKHVSDFVKNPKLTDSSGVRLAYQTTPSSKLGGVHLSVSEGEIPAHSVTYMETSCSYTGQAVLHPFAFRTHTHSLGRVVSGYRVRNGRWSLIGSANPQEPQMFYPVNGTGTVKPGDQLAAKCVMENTGDSDVRIGATRKDEMCNFYLMYWIAAADVGKDGRHMCYSNSDLWDSAPQDVADLTATIPGTKHMLQEFSQEMRKLDRVMEDLSQLGSNLIEDDRATEMGMSEATHGLEDPEVEDF